MDPFKNPYAPGAGARPPELAGRDAIIKSASIELARAANGAFVRGSVYYGLRGVGKTVLLNTLRKHAASQHYAVISLEVPERRSFISTLLPAIRSTLIGMSRRQAAKAAFATAGRFLNGLIKSARVKFDDIEVAIDLDAGMEDVTGNLEADLTQLFIELGRAAQERNTCVAMFVDELQYVGEEQLSVLLSAIHRVTQDELPFVLFAAGLPQALSLSGRAKTYAERLLKFQELGQLSADDARIALTEPAARAGLAFTDDAVREVIRQTVGYPYFIQEWGKHIWDLADVSPIQRADVDAATAAALAELDESFFKVRFDQLTPAEKRYMRAMAQLGTGPHRSGDVAAVLDRKVESVAPTRNTLIKKGMIYSPAHGDTAFTVPLFDAFMKRIIPELEH